MPEDAWYASYVDFAYNLGAMVGISDTEFGHDEQMSRAMFAMILYADFGYPEPTIDDPFTDVGDTWYTDAIVYLYEEGILAGTSETTFSPEEPITREQLVALFYKLELWHVHEIELTGDLSGYSDQEKISPYARDAVLWAASNGIISGTTPTTLSPSETATRAQCAAMVQRYAEYCNPVE